MLLQRRRSVHGDRLSLHFGQRKVGVEEETIHNFLKFLMLLEMAALCPDKPQRVLKLRQRLCQFLVHFRGKCVGIVAFDGCKKWVLIEEEKERSVDSVHISLHE